MDGKLVNDVLAILRDRYTLASGEAVQGQAISFVLAELRFKGWRNLGHLADFESLLESEGFRVVAGRNQRGGHARVVTV